MLGEREAFSRDATGQIRWGSEAAGVLFVGYAKKKRYVLLTLRSELVMDPNIWGIPGGRVEPYHKDAYETAIIETKEELGRIPFTEMKVIHTDEFRSGGFRYTTFVILVVGKELLSWKPRLNWENSGYKAFTKDELAELVAQGEVHPNVVRILRDISMVD